MTRNILYFKNVNVVNLANRNIDNFLLYRTADKIYLNIFEETLETHIHPTLLFGVEIKVNTNQIPFKIVHSKIYIIFFKKIVDGFKIIARRFDNNEFQYNK